ncbi:endothelin-converting enzyme 1-like isoform X2 [Vespula pensylvanica]|uniref:endothelin-converting enzyme 1-like isoform X2 n=1 Tax=Vespula pensylvanica TaxID=30213 RepID=UPI001CB9DE41|nr:endothelin-converting enzyme 1-like isoform X2 [Vespula pensylvanica]
MLKFWYLIAFWTIISMVIAIHRDALSEHEAIPSLSKYHHHTKHRHSSHGSHSSRGHHYPHGLEKLFEGKKKEEKTVCQSEECKLIARIIKDNINKSVDPCEDFYQYACGKFGENNPIPPGENSWSFIQVVTNNLKRQVEEILESDSTTEDLLTVKLGKKYFHTCTDHKNRERMGLEPLVTTMARIGGWPMIMEPEEWDETEHSWQKVDDYYAILTGHNSLYSIEVYVSPFENDTYVIMTSPRMPLGSRTWQMNDKGSSEEDDEDNKYENKEENEDYEDTKSNEDKDKGKNFNDEDSDSQQQDSQEKGSKDADSEELKNSKENRNMTEEYVNLITEIAMAVAKTRGFEIPENRIKADVNDVVIFQQKIMEIIDNSTNYDDDISLGEFQELYDNASITTETSKINFISKILTLFDAANIKIDEDFRFSVILTDFFSALNSLLNETPDRVIINYIHWLYISHIMDATTEKMEMLHNLIKTGKQSDKEILSKENRTKKCISEVVKMDVTAYAFVKKYFPDEIKNTAEEMIAYVQKEVEREISESKWLDDDIREFATEKVQNMKKMVGYPSWYSNSTIMKNYYKGLVIGPSYFENRMSYSRYNKWKDLRTLKMDSKYESIEDYITPLMLNALYAPFDNMMFVTAADFQNPFFAMSRPHIINYGIIGAIMGHEVNHGFDDNGRLYNKNGKQIQWLDTMVSAYNKRVECFVDQYDSLVQEEILKESEESSQSYGNRTRNENIADTMGLEASLGAYRIYEKENKGKSSEVLPGLENLSMEQLFFLSYANTFCEVVSPERLKKYKWDQHSTGQLRVLGPISNSESFAKSFNCPVGSRMNPKRKCNIWK